MNSISDYIRMFADEPEFDTARLNYTDCPECQGHNKLMVAQFEGTTRLFYRCFRDSCGMGEGVVDRGAYDRDRNGQYVDRNGQYVDRNGQYVGGRALRTTRNPENLPNALPWDTVVFNRVAARVHISAATLTRGSHGMTSEGQIILPVRGPSGALRGYQLRQGGLNHGPKQVLTQRIGNAGPDFALLAWYSPILGTGGTLVVVEDQYSAMRIAQAGYTAVALLGTSISEQGVCEIKDSTGAIRDVIVSLDKDATATGHKVVHLLRAKCASVRHLPLMGADVKDMNSDEFANYIAGVRG